VATRKKPLLRIQQSQLKVDGQFLRPVSRLLETGSGIVHAVLENLHDFGAALEGFRIDVNHQNLAQTSLYCPLLRGYGSLTLTAGGFALQLQGGASDLIPDVPRFVGEGQLSRLLVRAIEAVQCADEGAQLRSYSFVYSFHATVEGASQRDIIGAYASAAPELFGNVSDTAIRFSFLPREGDTGSWLLLEPSAAVTPDGLFVAATVEFDASKVPVSEAPALLQARLQGWLASPDFPVRIQ
jgi:hypothetical protein